jgi:hypothetical protein
VAGSIKGSVILSEARSKLYFPSKHGRAESKDLVDLNRKRSQRISYPARKAASPLGRRAIGLDGKRGVYALPNMSFAQARSFDCGSVQLSRQHTFCLSPSLRMTEL